MGGETCRICGRINCLGETERCFRTGYHRSQEALAAARRECDLLRAELAKCGNISVPHSQTRPEKA